MPASLPDDARERLVKTLRERVMPRFPDQSAAARAIPCDQSTLNRLVNSGRGGSLELVRRVAKFLNEPPDLILWGSVSEKTVRSLRELPNFAESMAEAVRRSAAEHTGITVSDLESAADTRAVPEPQRVTAGLLIHVALARQPSSETTRTRARISKR